VEITEEVNLTIGMIEMRRVLHQEVEKTVEALEMEINAVDLIGEDLKAEILGFAGIITEISIVADQMIAIKKVMKVGIENPVIMLIKEEVTIVMARVNSAIGSLKNLINATLGMKKTKCLHQNV
jgi:hypothetical protein